MKAMRIERRDIRSFDRPNQDLILEMVEAGWRGRISMQGHAVMYAPDGRTQFTVSRSSKRGRSGKNARADFAKWLKGINRN